jgi:hypothetical protein
MFWTVYVLDSLCFGQFMFWTVDVLGQKVDVLEVDVLEVDALEVDQMGRLEIIQLNRFHSNFFDKNFLFQNFQFNIRSVKSHVPRLALLHGNTSRSLYPISVKKSATSCSFLSDPLETPFSSARLFIIQARPPLD